MKPWTILLHKTHKLALTHTATVQPNALLVAGRREQAIVYRCECVSLADKAAPLVKTRRHTQ